MAKKTVLLVDLIGTLPVYTAYFTNSLVQNHISSNTLSPKRYEELDNFPFLETEYKFLFNHFKVTGFLKKYAKFISWILNCVYTLFLAPRYTNIHIIWLPLLKENNWDYYFVKFLLKRNPNVLFTVHATFHHDDYSEVYENRLKRICNMVPHLTTHSEFTRNDLVNNFQIDESKITVMGHGAMLQEFNDGTSEKETSPFTMSIIGSMRSYKGVEDALKLTSYLKRKGEHIKLVLAGSGQPDYLNEVRDMIQKYEVEDSTECIFRFLSTQEVIELNKKSNCILSLYTRIGQSGAAITALSLGTPVLGFNVGGLPFIIENFKNGFLSNPHEIEELEKGINWIKKESPSVIKKAIEELLEKNSWSNTASILNQIYK